MSNKPITRKEMFMAKASGQNVNTPKPITREEKFLEKIAKNGGKATSWKDLGEKTVMGDTLTWDGNTAGLECVDEMFYKVTDTFPTLAEIQNGITINTNLWEVSNVMVLDKSETFGCESYALINQDTHMPCVMGVSQTVTLDGTTYTKGLYFMNSDFGSGQTYVSSLQINNYNGFPRTEITPLPNKYLDFIETVGSDTLTWDGNTEGLESITLSDIQYYHVSDTIPTLEDCANGVVAKTSGGVEHTDEVMAFYDGILSTDGMAFFIIYESAVGVENEGITFPKSGIWFINIEDVDYITSITINGYNGFTTTKLKEEYIPVDYIKQLIAEVTGK